MEGGIKMPIRSPSTDFNFLMKLYVDMDGCLTDFNSAVRAIGGETGLLPNATEEQKMIMYRKIDNAGVSFWANMPWKEDGKKLWKVIRVFYPVILTSPGKFAYAVRGKNYWVKNNLPGTQLFFSNNKGDYAERDAVLIDDMAPNIVVWREVGGIGILHKNAKNTERQLLSLLSPTN